MKGLHANHPGHSAYRCQLRLTVNPHSTGVSSRGYVCSGTGGHCVPNEQCADRRGDNTDDMYIIYRWGDEEIARVATIDEMWDEIGKLPFGTGFSVGHENPDTVDLSQFIPF